MLLGKKDGKFYLSACASNQKYEKIRPIHIVDRI